MLACASSSAVSAADYRTDGRLSGRGPNAILVMAVTVACRVLNCQKPSIAHHNICAPQAIGPQRACLISSLSASRPDDYGHAPVDTAAESASQAFH